MFFAGANISEDVLFEMCKYIRGCVFACAKIFWDVFLHVKINPGYVFEFVNISWYAFFPCANISRNVFFHVPIYSGVCLSGTLSMFQYILGCVFCMSQYIQGCVFSCANISGDEFLHVQKGEKVCWE